MGAMPFSRKKSQVPQIRKILNKYLLNVSMNESFQMRGCFTKYFKHILEKVVVSTILLK